MDQQEGQDEIIVKITGVLVDVPVPVEDSPDALVACVVCENDRKTLCVEALKATCKMLTSALLVTTSVGSNVPETTIERTIELTTTRVIQL